MLLGVYRLLRDVRSALAPDLAPAPDFENLSTQYLADVELIRDYEYDEYLKRKRTPRGT